MRADVRGSLALCGHEVALLNCWCVRRRTGILNAGGGTQRPAAPATRAVAWVVALIGGGVSGGLIFHHEASSVARCRHWEGLAPTALLLAWKLGWRSSRASAWKRNPLCRSALLTAPVCSRGWHPAPWVWPGTSLSFVAPVLLNAEAPEPCASMPRGEKGEAEAGSRLTACCPCAFLPTRWQTPTAHTV